MKIDVSTPLDCSADSAWNEVQKSALLLQVIQPLATVTPIEPPDFPEHWREGMTVQCCTHLFGVIPLGMRTVHFEKIDHAARKIVTHESDLLVRRWDHTITVTPTGKARSIYRDVIDLDAGVLTFVVWAWTSWFYRHRQRRWRALAPILRGW
jgi:hypothetical protein